MLPYALFIGMTKKEFMKSKPIELKAYGKAFEMKMKTRDEELWLQGRYNLEALQVVFSHFGAGLSGKQSKAEYPKEPISFMKTNEELTEEEKERQREMFVARLKAMGANFELNNKSG